MMKISDDDEVAVVVNPAETIQRRFEDVKMRLNLLTIKPFPGAFQQVQREFASFNELLEAEKKILSEIEAEWSSLKRTVGIPFFESLQMPEDFRVATDQAIASFKEDLEKFYSDKGTEEYRIMSARLESLAMNAIAVGRGPEIEVLQANLQARGVPLLERLLFLMSQENDVEIVDLSEDEPSEPDGADEAGMVSIRDGPEHSLTDDEIRVAKENFRLEVEEYVKSILYRYYEANASKFGDPVRQGKALFSSLSQKVFDVEIHNWDLRRNRTVEQLVLTDPMKSHIEKYIMKKLDRYGK